MQRTRTREEIVALDRRHVWRPYTSTDDQRERDPLVIALAEGAWLVDADGTRYLDACASWWVSGLGHRHPRLVRALVEQLGKLDHVAMAGAIHPEAALLAEELAQVAPRGLDRVFFSDDGSTSVEVALKIAIQLFRQNGEPERARFISLAGAYHGDTAGGMSVGGLPELQGPYAPLLFEVIRPPPIDDEDGWERAVASIERTLETEGTRIAAVVVEPIVQGAAGMRIWAPPLLARLRRATEAAGALLVADEVFTGYGRTGPMWACEHAGVVPDLLCTAKSFSGGMLPFAATLATRRVFDGFSGGVDRALMHGHSFAGHALGAAVAREVLAVYREERVLERAAAKAGRIRDAFDAIGQLAGASHPQALGMVGAVEVGTPTYRGRIGLRVADAARRRGIYLRPLGNTVYVVPPLTIGDADLDRLLAGVHDAVAEALSL